MAFLIRFPDGPPEVVPGPPDRELAPYVPAGTPWRQVNYGQGEGQVEIDGREWGFYWFRPAELSVVLHAGEVGFEGAVGLVRRVAEQVAGPRGRFELLVAGESHRVGRPE